MKIGTGACKLTKHVNLKPSAIFRVSFVADFDVFTTSKVFADFTVMFFPTVVFELAVSVFVVLTNFTFHFKFCQKLLKYNIFAMGICFCCFSFLSLASPVGLFI
jgi:hypothetical protein